VAGLGGHRLKRTALLAILVLGAVATPPSAQPDPQTEASDPPLSVIDWLGRQAPPQPLAQAPTQAQPAALPRPIEPPVASSALPPEVTVTPLTEGSPREIGLVPHGVTGLPRTLWSGSEAERVIAQIEDLPDLRLPAAQSLLYTLLLAEAQAPQGGAAAGDALALARVRKLMALGALDPALSLIEQAGVTMSSEHFEIWMHVSLLTGTEDRACVTLQRNKHLTRDYAIRIFCNARTGDWDDAALTFGSAQALGLMEPDMLTLMGRFLDPEAADGAAPLRPPRRIDPLSFRLFEAIGEPLPTRNLPRAFAVADLRDIAGWKAQLEAAERLTRVGALPDNHLLGLYTDRKPAASGGVWDRVAALQRFETALSTGSAEAVAKSLPPVWEAMRAAELEVAFATLFADRLTEFDLTGNAAVTVSEVGLLSPSYEKVAADPATRASALARAVATGEAPDTRPDDLIGGAIYDAFADAAPRDGLLAQAREQRLGEAILTLLDLLDVGAEGDASALRDALATLRALGLEDTARRAALQTLLLSR
jgi:hypothetical protein